jgi:hypothetical protein
MGRAVNHTGAERLIVDTIGGADAKNHRNADGDGPRHEDADAALRHVNHPRSLELVVFTEIEPA